MWFGRGVRCQSVCTSPAERGVRVFVAGPAAAWLAILVMGDGRESHDVLSHQR